MPRVIKVIEAEESVGAGTTENPYRTVKRIFSISGKLMASHDPFLEDAKRDKETLILRNTYAANQSSEKRGE